MWEKIIFNKKVILSLKIFMTHKQNMNFLKVAFDTFQVLFLHCARQGLPTMKNLQKMLIGTQQCFPRKLQCIINIWYSTHLDKMPRCEIHICIQQTILFNWALFWRGNLNVTLSLCYEPRTYYITLLRGRAQTYRWTVPDLLRTQFYVIYMRTYYYELQINYVHLSIE